MDLKKLSKADQVIGASAIVLLIASFLPWFKLSVGGGILGDISTTGNGWDVGFLWGGLPTILGLIMLAHVAITNFSPQTKLPDLPVTWGQIHLGAGVLAALLVVLKFLIGESDEGGLLEVSRSFGLFLAVIAAIGLAVGGFLKFKEPQAATAPPTSF